VRRARVAPADDGGPRYASWIAARERRWLADASADCDAAARPPTLSVVVPTFETPVSILRACLDSVRAQRYERWELCIADDGSTSSALHRALDEYAQRDPRVRLVRLATRVGIAQATNAALDLATGAYVCFLDHDDVLPAFALAEVARHLAADPDTDVLYSDEDRLDPQGRRVRPFFKPDWSPDLLRSVNYMCHFLVVRRDLLEAAGRLRAGFDGAQDYDLLLRLAERTDRIGHVPCVLYQWRASPTSTAGRPDAKPAASASGVRALREHLARCGEEAAVDDPHPTSYRVRYRLRGEPTVAIVAPRDGDLEALARGLAPTTTAARWALHPAASRARGAAMTRGDFLLFLHDDVAVRDPEWLDELLGHAQRDGVGAVAPTLLRPDGTIEHAGLVVRPDGTVLRPFAGLAHGDHWTTMGASGWVRNYLAVGGACLCVRRDRYEAAGGFDERLAGWAADVDLCLRLRRHGLRTVYTPHAVLVHRGGRGTSWDALPPGPLATIAPRHDPFYNPNLSLDVGSGRLRDP
jgi:GT2 family glycosyltransferase